MAKRAQQVAERLDGESFSVEIHHGERMLRRYRAPFETAARALAKEVTRRLSPETGLRVVIQTPTGGVTAWSAVEGGWQPPRAVRGRRAGASQLSLFVGPRTASPRRKLLPD